MASLARPTAGRAVHLRITPRPSNISDSREILRLVSQFGEVEYFKNLKYDALSHPGSSLVIFRDQKAAEACLKRSPIRFRLGPAEADLGDHQASAPVTKPPPSVNNNTTPAKGPISSPFGMPQTRSLSTASHSLPIPPHPAPSLPHDFLSPRTNKPEPTSRIFQLQTNPAHYNFRYHVDRAEYHGRFMIDGKSAIQNDLAKRVPTLGLSCWEWRKGEKPDRVVQGMRQRDGVGRSLMSIWEEGRELEK
jgi:hypothetical protein